MYKEEFLSKKIGSERAKRKEKKKKRQKNKKQKKENKLGGMPSFLPSYLYYFHPSLLYHFNPSLSSIITHIIWEYNYHKWYPSLFYYPFCLYAFWFYPCQSFSCSCLFVLSATSPRCIPKIGNPIANALLIGGR